MLHVEAAAMIDQTPDVTCTGVLVDDPQRAPCSRVGASRLRSAQLSSAVYLLLLLICQANNLPALPDSFAAECCRFCAAAAPALAAAPDPDAAKPSLCGCSAPASWVCTGVSLVSRRYDTWMLPGRYLV